MKKAKKILVLAMSACLLVAVTIGATVAYLTDTKTVNNTFTVGNVKIKLDEAVAEYDSASNTWKATNARTDEGQSYKLLPGTVVEKDPTVTVLAKSEDCYVRALITVTNKEALDKIFAEYDLALENVIGGISTDWTVAAAGTPDGDTRVYEVRYKSIVPASTSDTVLDDIFESITVPGDLNNTEIASLENLSITVVAQAIQADGFDDADEAWEAFSAE